MPKDDSTELFYWVDENDQELGSIVRKEAHGGGRKIHRSVYVLVFDGNKLLLQKRSMKKDTHPGKWTVSTSGHVTYGQSYAEAAKRELEEEVGIVANELIEIGFMKYNSDTEREVSKIYSCTYHDQKITPDEDEISQVKWVDKDKLKEFSKENPLTPAARQVFKIMKLI